MQDIFIIKFILESKEIVKNIVLYFKDLKDRIKEGFDSLVIILFNTWGYFL